MLLVALNVLVVMLLIVSVYAFFFAPAPKSSDWYSLVTTAATVLGVVYVAFTWKAGQYQKEKGTLPLIGPSAELGGTLVKASPALLWLVVVTLFYFELSNESLRFGDFYSVNSMYYHFLLAMYPTYTVLRGVRTRSELGISMGRISPMGLAGALAPIAANVAAILFQVQYRGRPPMVQTNWLLIVLYLFVGPVTEEMFFRGYLQMQFSEKSVSGGWVLTSLVFTGIHVPKIIYAPTYFLSPISVIPSFIPATNPIYALGYMFLSSLGLSWLYSETKSLVPSIVAHALLNFGALLVFK